MDWSGAFKKTGMFILSAVMLFGTAALIRKDPVKVSDPSFFYLQLGMAVGVLFIVFGWFGDPKNKD